MTSSYDDLAAAAEMRHDARAAGRHLGLKRPLERAARRAVGPAPSLHFDEQPAETPKRGITIDAAATRLAAALGLDR